MDAITSGLDIAPGGTLHISNRRLDEIIMLAYNIGVKQFGPRWLTEPTTDPSVVTRYEIVAKVPSDATKDQIPQMLQKLLEDGFKLQVHHETRTTQTYVLGIGKGGRKLDTSVPNNNRKPGCARVIMTCAELTPSSGYPGFLRRHEVRNNTCFIRG